ncbi:MDR family NADP-dependent oxidoreductase [Amycolatopsis suaedae]|uniref:NADP-dependent oxidoreductase n=1 Tax=Amycolatopsis suaedae TaxID=2510978 RepID=A0A4Q7J109_9PSEU|nr:NADP-dependent oxidoreductase [Amycolatopsis suaedae]RZQ60096.1 NADP-dependent oxidoreductase [Amycolatopsis suaedae]
MNVPARAREVRLVARPGDRLGLEHFTTAEVDVPEPDEGQFLVRNDWMVLSIVMRSLMDAEVHPDLPMSGYRLNEAPWAPAIGTVVRSRAREFAVGDVVSHTRGFREYVLGQAEDWEFSKLDTTRVPGPEYYLNQGVTAWRGMVTVADVGEGDTVFVSGATTAVGSLAGQIARCRGAKRVIGSTGDPAKIGYLVGELGFDAAFDYHDGPVLDRLIELAPDGLDVVFDNVAGEQFEAALQAAAPNARFALCGALSGRSPVLDLDPVVLKDLTIRGFTTPYEPADVAEWTEHYTRWLAEGRFVFPHTVVEGGAGAVPQAMLDVVAGRFRGTVLVRLS